MKILLARLLLFVIVGSIAFLLWRMHCRQRAESRYHDSLPRSVRLVSDSFEDNGRIPIEFTCKGTGMSPPLNWSNIPEGTKSLVLLVTDDELPTSRLRLFKIVHWVLYNIPPDVGELTANVKDVNFGGLGIVAGRNWSKRTNYYPPCPLYGRHVYAFRIYALDVGTIRPGGDNRKGVFRAMENHVLAYGELRGFCER